MSHFYNNVQSWLTNNWPFGQIGWIDCGVFEAFSVVISGPVLRTSAASMTSTASTTSMTSTASFHQKIYWSCWLDHPWHPNDQYWPLLVEWIIKILLNLEAVEASRCYFFENRWKKLKFPIPLKTLGTII